MKKNIFFRGITGSILGLVLILLTLSVDSLAQERTRLRLSFVKDTNGDKNINVTLYSGRGRDMVYLEDAIINLYASNNDTTIELSQLSTDADGMATLVVQNGYQFPLDEDGFTIIEATYEGTDEYRGSSNDILVKDLNLDVEFDLVDSVKTVFVTATEMDNEGNPSPVEGLILYVGVQRLYSILPIGEIYDSEEGVYSIEMPDNIPGDSTGNLQVVARIEDNEFYGSVNKREFVQWGIPVSFDLEPVPRRLWTEEAPFWMIISVFVILLGAWFHFFYSIYKLSRIKKVADLE